MEEFRKKSAVEPNDKEIIFSKSIKAGKRIYYMDVKKNRKDEMFLAITESKKIITGEGTDPQVSFEKHKIFLYKEDFEKFMSGLEQAIDFINGVQGTADSCSKETELFTDTFKESADSQTVNPLSDEIKIDIDF